MKYRLLTKEQFEELHEEFATFLASQQIDANEWHEIKKNKPEVAQQELEVFSDFVWDRVLGKAEYLEHTSEKAMNLFYCAPEQILRVVVQVEKEGFSFFDKTSYKWFLDNSQDSTISYFKGQKPYLKERNQEIFELIEQGSVISNGALYRGLIKIISK
ncbi:DUF6495 family protein [Urechidicola sp. KH5]